MLISKEYILVNSCVSPDHETINYKNLSLILRLHNSPFIISPTHLHETQQKRACVTGAGGMSFEMFVLRLHPGTPFFLVALCILWRIPRIHELWEAVRIVMSPPRILTFWSLL